MAKSLDDLPPLVALVEIAHDFHARGWMAGTAGNVSARDDENHFWISASGRPKGRLDEHDFILVRIADGAVIERARPGNEPSAETAVHRTIYSLFPGARACLHGHSVDACLAAGRAGPKTNHLRLPPLEMIKGFGIRRRNPRVDLPLFVNHLDISRIARDISARFRKTAPAVTALMIRTHGATVWGAGLQQAYDRFEILDFLLQYLSRRGSR